jgi:hypothetical protein
MTADRQRRHGPAGPAVLRCCLESREREELDHLRRLVATMRQPRQVRLSILGKPMP